MKKFLAVLMCAMLVSAGSAITASALDSPTVNPGDNSSKPTIDTEEDTEGGSSSEGNSSTSPATGAPVSYGVLMAAAVAAFGGVALATRKKIKEN